jgi:hypothetical protein
MSARMLLPLFALALAVPIHAAPAPFQRPAPDDPDVVLRGWIRDQSVAACAPSFITTQTDYESVAKAWGITTPPRVDFRTHFLFVYVSNGRGEVRCEIDGKGDLRGFGGNIPDDGNALSGLRVAAGQRYLIKSFRRSAVKTVNGVALPKK